MALAEVEGTAFPSDPSSMSNLLTVVFIPAKLCLSCVLWNHNQNVLEVSFPGLGFHMTIPLWKPHLWHMALSAAMCEMVLLLFCWLVWVESNLPQTTPHCATLLWAGVYSIPWHHWGISPCSLRTNTWSLSKSSFLMTILPHIPETAICFSNAVNPMSIF